LELRSECKILFGRPDGMKILWRIQIDGRIILKWILQKESVNWIK